MRIFSKRSFQFDHPAGEQPAVVVRSQSFADVPDWVADSAMYKLALDDEDVMPIESRQDEVKAELGSPDKATRAKAREAAKAQKKAEAEAAAAAAEQERLKAETAAAEELKALQAKAAELQITDADKMDRDQLSAAIAAASGGAPAQQ
jgi:hypothetical protein